MPDPEPNEPTPGDPELGDAGKRAIAAERARADAAEKALKAFTEAGFTDPAAVRAELDRLTTENASLTTSVNDLTETNGTLTSQNRRLTVGIDKGLPKELIARLQGDDDDALSADADALLQFVPPASVTPLPDPSQGPKPNPPASTPAQVFGNFLTQQLKS